MTCHVTLRHVASRRVASRHVMSRYVTSCHVMSRHATSCYVVKCRVASCPCVVSCRVAKSGCNTLTFFFCLQRFGRKAVVTKKKTVKSKPSRTVQGAKRET